MMNIAQSLFLFDSEKLMIYTSLIVYYDIMYFTDIFFLWKAGVQHLEAVFPKYLVIWDTTSIYFNYLLWKTLFYLCLYNTMFVKRSFHARSINFILNIFFRLANVEQLHKW